MRAMVLLYLLGTAHAHTVGISRADFEMKEDGTVDARFVFAAAEVAFADRNKDGTVSAAEVEGSKEELRRLVVDGVGVTAAGEACPGSFESAELTEADGLAVSARYACATTRELAVTMFLLTEMKQGHRQLVRLAQDSTSVQKVLTGDQRYLKLDASAPKHPTRPWTWKAKLAVALCSVWVLLFGGLVIWRFLRRKKA
jgi:hypothetical protein